MTTLDSAVRKAGRPRSAYSHQAIATSLLVRALPNAPRRHHDLAFFY